MHKIFVHVRNPMHLYIMNKKYTCICAKQFQCISQTERWTEIFNNFVHVQSPFRTKILHFRFYNFFLVQCEIPEITIFFIEIPDIHGVVFSDHFVTCSSFHVVNVGLKIVGLIWLFHLYCTKYHHKDSCSYEHVLFLHNIYNNIFDLINRVLYYIWLTRIKILKIIGSSYVRTGQSKTKQAITAGRNNQDIRPEKDINIYIFRHKEYI